MGENGRRRCALFTCPREKNKKEDLLVGMLGESPRLGRMFMTTGVPHREKFATWEIYLCNLPELEIPNSAMKVSDEEKEKKKKPFDRKSFEISKDSSL